MSTPTGIILHRRSRELEITFDDGQTYRLPFEYLRVWSPSAEVRGHGGDIRPPVAGKRDVEIANLESVGNYAVRPIFSDGHQSGIFSWDCFREMGENYNEWWTDYLARLKAAGKNRDEE